MRRMRAVLFTFALTLAVAPALAEEQSLDALARAIDQTPEDPAAYDAYAKAALKAKKFDDVIHHVKIGVARIPSYGQGYYWLAFAYRAKKEWADAADYYRRYITLNPTKTDPYFGLGAALEGLGDKKGAIAAYDKYVALEKAPEKQRFVELAKGELVKLDPSRAPPPPPPVAPPPPPPPVATTMKPTTVAMTPPPPPSAEAAQLRAAAEQLQREGKLEDAVMAYQHAIEADRNNIELYNNLGTVYFTLKRYADAARAFRETVARDPTYAQGWYNLAHAYRKGDQKQEAVQAYRAYMKLKPDDPDPYYGLGQTLKALGDVSGAIDAFRKYVSMEKRAEEQPWVDKARAELQALEAMRQPIAPPPPAHPSGRIEEKSSGDRVLDRVNQTLDRELQRPPRERDRDRERGYDTDDLMNPFDGGPGRTRMLRNPFPEDLEDPFAKPSAKAGGKRELREYGAAIEAYRRALSREVDDVAASYERGVAFALADDAAGATRAWNGVKLSDTRVDVARKNIERVRQLLASRR
jgi:tetratricopeptide (TPR) repeat protein